MSELAATQRWMQQVIGDVDGVDAGLARAAAATGRQPLAAEHVVHGSAALPARERLALYTRTYEQRLVGCLRESYPALRHALGDELFDDFAREYLSVQPSRSYTLTTLGAAWPDHLESTRPDRDRPPHERERWPDFLVDLARLERTFLEVYDGVGPEGGPLLSVAELTERLPPAGADAWDAITVSPVPGLRLVAARFDVAAFLVAVRAGEQPVVPAPAPAPACVAVSRRDYVVTITRMSGAERALLQALAARRSLAAATRVAGLSPSTAHRALRDWAGRGLLATLDVPVSPSKRGVVSP